MNREPNHTLTGEPYKRTLTQRADLACEAIGRMASEGRGPRMSIPAGRNLHSTPPGDEDLFITDVIEDLQHEVERLRARVTELEADPRATLTHQEIAEASDLLARQIEMKRELARQIEMKRELAALAERIMRLEATT